MRHVIDGAREDAEVEGPVRDTTGRRSNRSIGPAGHRDGGGLGEGVLPVVALHLGGERGGLGAEIEDLGQGPLLRLPHLHRRRGDEARDEGIGIVEVARHDGLHGTDDGAGRLEPHLHAVRAVVALGGGLGLGVDVERVVGTGLQARLATDAARAVEVHDAVGPAVEGHRGTDRHAGGVVAVIAAQHGEVAARVGEGALLDVLHPGAVDAERDLVLFLAGHRARMTPDALPLVDHESVAHARCDDSPVRFPAIGLL
jgi:hypothetical protein